MVLTHSQAQAFYDRFGKRQDSQAFFEDAALDELISHGAFERAESVFELGCGTGRFAARLLTKHLSPNASYLGIDLSRTMIDIAERRIAANAQRARVIQSDGSLRFPIPDQSVDRVAARRRAEGRKRTVGGPASPYPHVPPSSHACLVIGSLEHSHDVI